MEVLPPNWRIDEHDGKRVFTDGRHHCTDTALAWKIFQSNKGLISIFITNFSTSTTFLVRRGDVISRSLLKWANIARVQVFDINFYVDDVQILLDDCSTFMDQNIQNHAEITAMPSFTGVVDLAARTSDPNLVIYLAALHGIKNCTDDLHRLQMFVNVFDL